VSATSELEICLSLSIDRNDFGDWSLLISSWMGNGASCGYESAERSGPDCSLSHLRRQTRGEVWNGNRSAPHHAPSRSALSGFR